MAQIPSPSKPNCYMEFRVYDKARFETLKRFFEPLKAWTQNDNSPQPPKIEDATQAHRFAKAETQEGMAIGAREETQTRRAFARPEEWLLALRPQDLGLLGMPPHADSIRVMREWQGLSRRERRKAIQGKENEEALRVLSDFAEMLRYWQDVQFELVSCEMTESDIARLTYMPFDFPYEGKTALEEMLMFFGFLSIINSTC